MQNTSIFTNRFKRQELLWLMLSYPKLTDRELAFFYKTDRKIIHWYRVRYELYEPKKRLSPSAQSYKKAKQALKEAQEHPIDFDGEPLIPAKKYKQYLAEDEARSKKLNKLANL